MKNTYLLFFAVIAFLALACNTPKFSLKTYNGYAQGTTFSIKYYSPDNKIYNNKIDSLLELMDKTASIWDSLSIISKINRNEPVVLNEQFIKLINKSLEISEITNGYFDITVGEIVNVWGFGRKKGIEPDKELIDSLLKNVGYKKISLKQTTFAKENANIIIDLNAIAQGYTVDLIATLFNKLKIKNYLIEIGGEVYAKGKKENNNLWKIGIEKPEKENTENAIQTIVNLKDKAIATSGNYRKYFVKNGQKFSHAIDPFTGYPVCHNLLSVTVLAKNCSDADAFATAFLVMGRDKAKELLKQLPDLQVLFIYANPNGLYETEYINGFEKNEVGFKK